MTRETPTISPPRDDAEVQQYRAIAARSLFFDIPDGAQWPRGAALENLRVARIGGVVAGGYTAIPLGQWFGGRVVPMAGIGAVAVAPEHRGRGVAGALIRNCLAEARARGQAISTLYPATQQFYRRFGWEQAGSRIQHRVPLTAFDERDRPLEMREATDADEPTLRALHARRARSGAGHLERGEWAWERLLRPVKPDGRKVYLVGDEGYLIVAQRTEASGNGLLVLDHVALTDAAARRIRAFFADHRSMAEDVTLWGAPAELLLAPLDRMGVKVERVMRWMLRVVDVQAALEARGWPRGVRCAVHLDVRDDIVAENARKIVLEIDDGTARVTAGGEGRIRVDVRGLAPLFTGYLSPFEARSLGLIEGDEDDLARLGAAFAGPQPWMADMF